MDRTALVEQLNETNAELEQLRQEKETNGSEAETQRQQLAEAQEKLDTALTELETQKQTAAETQSALETEVEKLRAQLTETETAYAAFQQESETLTKGQEASITDLQLRLNNAYAALKTLATHLSASLMNTATTAQERNEYRARLDGIRGDIEAQEAEKQALQAEVDRLTLELAETYAALDQARQSGTPEEIEALHQQIEVLTSDLTAAQDTINYLLEQMNETPVEP